jgi:hypothetical protein
MSIHRAKLLLRCPALLGGTIPRGVLFPVMARWIFMLLTSLTLALGPNVLAMVAACQPAPVAAVSGCGEGCCCGDEAQCPCVQRAPDESDRAPSAPRPTGEPRPLLVPPPGYAAPVIVVSAGRALPIGTVRAPAPSPVRSQARLCRWRT